MFTGIIEELGVVQKITKEKNNLLINIKASFLKDLAINQSISHDGICLTVTQLNKKNYTVCVVQETIRKTNINYIKKGDLINLERCLVLGDRLDGHFVQGHVDCTAQCVDIQDKKGSWHFKFNYNNKHAKYLVNKGSISINGVSLTIANIDDENNCFEVAIIPYTFQNTNFKSLKLNNLVNLEFDFLSKQLVRLNSIK